MTEVGHIKNHFFLNSLKKWAPKVCKKKLFFIAIANMHKILIAIIIQSKHCAGRKT